MNGNKRIILIQSYGTQSSLCSIFDKCWMAGLSKALEWLASRGCAAGDAVGGNSTIANSGGGGVVIEGNRGHRGSGG
jgi:hypothetical protein